MTRLGSRAVVTGAAATQWLVFLDVASAGESPGFVVLDRRLTLRRADDAPVRPLAAVTEFAPEVARILAPVVAQTLDYGERVDAFSVEIAAIGTAPVQTVRLACSPIRDSAGVVVGAGLWIDRQSPGVRTPEALIDAFRATLDAANVGVALADAATGQLRYANAAFQLLAGESIGGEGALDEAHPPLLSLIGSPVALDSHPLTRALVTDRPVPPSLYRLVGPDGVSSVVRVSAAPVPTDRGALIALVVEPMTTARQAVALRAVAQAIPRGLVALFDSAQRIELVAGSVAEAPGFAIPNAEGRRLADVLAPDLARELDPLLHVALTGGTASTSIARDSGVWFATVTPVLAGGDTVIGGVLVLQESVEFRPSDQPRDRPHRESAPASDLPIPPPVSDQPRDRPDPESGASPTSLQQARLEGVALAGREIAHLLNNDITASLGAVDLLLQDTSLSPPAQELLKLALDGLEAATLHIQQFQQVTRVVAKDTPIGRTLDLPQSVSTMVQRITAATRTEAELSGGNGDPNPTNGEPPRQRRASS